MAKILFAKGSSQHLESLAKSGADVLSVDWKTDLGRSAPQARPPSGPAGKCGPEHSARCRSGCPARRREAVEKTGGVGHILNLGHGILPGTPVANAKAFVEAGPDGCSWLHRQSRRDRTSNGGHKHQTPEKLEIGQISDEILEKYNRPGPALHELSHRARLEGRFRPRRSRKILRARRSSERTPLSLYMHLPFCESLCLFCACNVSIQKDKSVAIPYLAALKKEIEHVAGRVSKTAA